jgi:small subunit ribosomal protein S20
MPIIQSAIKRAGQNIKRHERLLPYRTHIKTMVRKVKDLANNGKIEEAKKILPDAYKAIDMAAKKNIIHKSNAARRKSMLAKLVSTKK